MYCNTPGSVICPVVRCALLPRVIPRASSHARLPRHMAQTPACRCLPSFVNLCMSNSLLQLLQPASGPQVLYSIIALQYFGVFFCPGYESFCE